MSVTQINVRVSEGRSEPERKRVNIPGSDHVTLDWWDAQENIHTSIRLLILTEARDHGPVDRVNRLGIQAPATCAGVPATSTAAGLDPRDAQIVALQEELEATKRVLAEMAPLVTVRVGAE